MTQDAQIIVGALEARPGISRRHLAEATRLTDLRIDGALSDLLREGRVLRMGRGYYLAGQSVRPVRR